jgi:hypothetical protein
LGGCGRRGGASSTLAAPWRFDGELRGGTGMHARGEARRPYIGGSPWLRGEGINGNPTVVRRPASVGARDRERARTDRRATAGAAGRRTQGLHAAEGDFPRGAAHGPVVAGLPRYARTVAYRGTAVRRARARWSAAAHSGCGLFRVATFDSEKL